MLLCKIVESFWWYVVEQPPMLLYPSEDVHVGSKLQKHSPSEVLTRLTYNMRNTMGVRC